MRRSTPTPAVDVQPLNAATLMEASHPYVRYGFAVALVRDKKVERVLSESKENLLSESEIAEMLAISIEAGLERFRMRTNDDPAVTRTLRFEPIKAEDLKSQPDLVSGNLAPRGIYLYPSIISIDKGAAKLTYNESIKSLGQLKAGNSLLAEENFKRSFAPMTAEMNNGKPSLSTPCGTLLEAACSVITTLTPEKPAMQIANINTAIIPDLSLKEMCDFVALFDAMTRRTEDLMVAQLGKIKDETQPKKPVQNRKVKASVKAASKSQSEYRRPKLHNGNYPYAPYDPAAFGAIGLLGAIGRWANEAGKIDWAQRVLESIAGTPERAGRPLYIIAYDAIKADPENPRIVPRSEVQQIHFHHHIVRLSIEGRLSEIVEAFKNVTLFALLDAEEDGNKEKKEKRKKAEIRAKQFFRLQASRFLQQFTLASFADLLAVRAEYPPLIKSLWEEYFMNTRKIPREVVESARALGQHLNWTAYVVADNDVEKLSSDDPKIVEKKKQRTLKVNKGKAKILVEFESAAMSAKTPLDMLHRISTRAGRLLQNDLPATAAPFMDAASAGELDPQDAVHLLIAYLRLRSVSEKKENKKDESGEQTDRDSEDEVDSLDDFISDITES